jgi:hypothetical protein
VSHWLDDAARGLAEGTHTRRSVIRRGGAVAAGGVLASMEMPLAALAGQRRCGKHKYDPKIQKCCPDGICGHNDTCCGHYPKGQPACCTPGFQECCRGEGESSGLGDCADLFPFGKLPQEPEHCCHGGKGNPYVCKAHTECCNFYNTHSGESHACCQHNQACCGGPAYGRSPVGIPRAGCYDPSKAKCCHDFAAGVVGICPKDNECCHGECCKADEMCCGLHCCNPSDCDNDVCTPSACSPEHPHGTCPSGQTCCGGYCCPSGFCPDGQCVARCAPYCGQPGADAPCGGDLQGCCPVGQCCSANYASNGFPANYMCCPDTGHLGTACLGTCCPNTDDCWQCLGPGGSCLHTSGC